MQRVITAPQRLIPTLRLAQSEPSHESDPYPYGWREVCHTFANGQTRRERVPLTLEDILHPQTGDFIVHSDEHQFYCKYLYNVLEGCLKDDPNAFVLSDVRISWDNPDLDPHGPDLAVIFNVRKWQDWSTFDTVQEGTKPSLIIEVTSPKTRLIDLDNKVKEYQQAGVPLYVIVDRAKGKKRIKRRLVGYQLSPNGYVRMKPNQFGWLWIEPVGLWLAFRGRQLVCYDEWGQLIGNYKTVVAKLEKAKKEAALYAKAKAAAEAKAQAEAKAKAAAEAKAQAEAKAKAAAEAKAQAEAKARAKAEARATKAESELERLRAEIARLRGSEQGQ